MAAVKPGLCKFSQGTRLPKWATKRFCLPAPHQPSWRATVSPAPPWPKQKALDLIVMDDGHQNFALVKDLSLVVVDGETGFGNRRMIPAGPLREPVVQGLARADTVIIMNDGHPDLGGYVGSCLRARLTADAANLSGQRVFAFAGIGRPEKFVASLKEAGAIVTGVQSFPDHHVFHASEMAALRIKAEGVLLVTTEKDFVRLVAEQRAGVVTLPVHARFDDEAALEALLARFA